MAQCKDILQAACAVTSGAGPVFTMNVGCTSVTRTSAGIHVVTLDVAAPATECEIVVTPLVAAARFMTATHTSDTVKTVTSFDATPTAADVNFSMRVSRHVN